MGIAYRTHSDLGCIVVVWHGEVTADETAEHLVRLADDPAWPPRRAHLTDLTTATELALPSADLVDALTEGTDVRERVARAIVIRPGLVDETDVEEAGGSLGLIPEVFTDLDHACAYLDVNAPAVRATIDELRAGLDRSEQASRP
jgi:hypothetical protein